MKLGKFLCFSKSAGGKDRPKGVIWLTACFMYVNIRLLPVGYRFQESKWINYKN